MRNKFNDATRIYNPKVRQFPTKLSVLIWGFKEKPYFSNDRLIFIAIGCNLDEFLEKAHHDVEIPVQAESLVEVLEMDLQVVVLEVDVLAVVERVDAM